VTIDQALEQAARAGRLSLSIFAASEGYQASLSTDRKSFRVEMAPDPATALRKVLGLLPGASGPMRSATPATGGGVFD
jgi:hypothetical protein